MSDDYGDGPVFFAYGTGEERYSPGVTRIRVHSSVMAIRVKAFSECWQLVTVILNDGLEEISTMAFHDCISLKHIKYPPPSRRLSGMHPDIAQG
jgi:hypothetical protein